MTGDSWAEWRNDLAALLATVGRAEKQAYMERHGMKGAGGFLSERVAVDFECRAKALGGAR